jgi:hypothetical protein
MGDELVTNSLVTNPNVTPRREADRMSAVTPRSPDNDADVTLRAVILQSLPRGLVEEMQGIGLQLRLRPVWSNDPEDYEPVLRPHDLQPPLKNSVIDLDAIRVLIREESTPLRGQLDTIQQQLALLPHLEFLRTDAAALDVVVALRKHHTPPPAYEEMPVPPDLPGRERIDRADRRPRR